MRTGKVIARDLHDMMPTVVYGKMTDDDLKSIFAYLETLTPVKHRVDNSLSPTARPVCNGTHGGRDGNVKAAN